MPKVLRCPFVLLHASSGFAVASCSVHHPMLRCVTGQAFASQPATTLAAICRYTRHVVVKAHKLSQPQQQPLKPQTQQPGFEEEILNAPKDIERDVAAHCRDISRQLVDLSEQLSATSDRLDVMLEDVSAMSATSRLFGSNHPRKSRLQLEVGERAGSHGTFRTVPDWLQRLAVPLQAADIPPAVAQANVIRNLLKV